MRRLLAVAALLPALTLSACGSGAGKTVTESRKPLDIVRLAGESTTEAGTAKLAMAVDGAGVTMTGEGVTSLEETKAAITMKMAAGGQTIDMEMVMLDQMLYIKMPAGMNPTGKPWVSLDLDALSKQAGFDIAQLQQLKSADPTSTLAYFKGVSDDVKEVGEEDVRGEKTTKYTATFDIAKAIENVEDADGKKALQDATSKLGVNEIPATIWIDGDGRMRKMVQTFDLSKIEDAQGATGEMTMTFELYDFGTDLDVKAPPADQVGDGAALFGGGQSG